MEIQRKLASVQRIAEVKPIEGADAIEAVRINGWWVVAKKGEFKEGSLCVYLEIDSWVPHEIAPFLTKGKEPREFEGVKGERLRTIRLRGQLSQGLVLPLEPTCKDIVSELTEDLDLTVPLNIKKWEKPIPAQLAGMVKGNFPPELQKTDQQRVQNIRNLSALMKEHRWEVTEKLHGSSCTFYLDKEGEFHVCSRNIDLKYDENNSFWKAAIKYDIENRMKYMLLRIFGTIRPLAIQGELIGEGINGNQYQKSLGFYVFDLFNPENGTYCPADIRAEIVEYLELDHVPVIYSSVHLPEIEKASELLVKAEGMSLLNASQREGLVFKSLDDPSVSFKVVSDKWLLEND